LYDRWRGEADLLCLKLAVNPQAVNEGKL
jgi:hypothetical protein